MVPEGFETHRTAVVEAVAAPLLLRKRELASKAGMFIASRRAIMSDLQCGSFDDLPAIVPVPIKRIDTPITC